MLSEYALSLLLGISLAVLLFGVYWTIKLTRKLPSVIDDLYDGGYLDR